MLGRWRGPTQTRTRHGLDARMRRFTVHAPSAERVQLQLTAPVRALHDMHRADDGSWWW